MVKHFVLVMLVSVIFCGCAKNDAPIYKYPEWYLNIQNDTNNQFFAVGEGKTLQDATNVALNDIAARISVSLESSYSSKTTSSGEKFSSISQREIKNSIQRIEFTNYQVLKKELNQQERNIVLIKVDKGLLASSMETKILNDIEKIREGTSQKYNNTMKKIAVYQKFKSELHSIESSILILHTLNELADTKNLLESVAMLSKNCDIFLQAVTFKIVTVSGTSEYESILSSLITKKGFSVVSSNEIISFKISISEQPIKSMENKILKAVINIEAYDSISNKKIGEETITVAGKSILNFDQSKSFALKDFENKLTVANIMQLIFAGQ